MNNNYRDILDAAARTRVPDNINLFPRIAARLERKPLLLTLRARPVFVLLIVLVSLALLTGAVYAIGRSLGYIPGVGIIDQGSPIRVLAEPVSQERDGIILTVTDAILTNEKTVILYTLENVPWSALSHDENVSGCYETGKLLLPDGETLRITEGGGTMTQYRFVFAPLPADVDKATFILPCIMNTLPGLAPENWQLTLDFKPAPPDMIVVPVVEIAPTTTPAFSSATASPQTFAPVQLTQALQVGDDYVLVGTKTDRNSIDQWLELTGFKMTDASGAEVYGQTPKVEGITDFDWGVQFKGSTVNFPVTLVFDWIRIAPVPDSRAEFIFDAGENPQPGQEWTLNQPIQIGGRTILLRTVRTDGRNGYSFEFTCDPDITGAALDLPGYTSNGGGGGGGYGLGQFSASLAYAELPKGKLQVVLSNLTVATPPQTWTMQWSPENPPTAASLYGISLTLDKFIPIDDGYYLIGHTEWTDKRIKSISPAGWVMKATDANGQELAIEPAEFERDTPLNETLNSNQWAYHIYGKAFNAPVTLQATQLGVEFTEPVRLTLDMSSYGFEFNDEHMGMPYKTGIIPLDVPGLTANAFKATYIKEGDLRGFDIGIEADPALLGLSFGIESGLDTTGMFAVSGGGGSYRDEKSGLLISRVTTDAPMSFPLVFAAREAQIGGDWTVDWVPPAAEAGATPFIAPAACVTLETWKQAVANPPAIPSDLPQKVLVSRGAISPDPSLFIANLDGSNDQALVFGNGSLSPDGSKLVYSDENNSLQILDIGSGKKQVITTGNNITPFWSPDGTKIAFSRVVDKGQNIFIVDSDGKNMRALTDTTDNPNLVGWTSDSHQLILTITQQDKNLIQKLDITTGLFQPLITTSQTWDSSVAISPDGNWMAYVDKVSGKMAPGIFVSHLDGTEKRLLVQLDYWMAIKPLWSPGTLSGTGGNWLAFTVLNQDAINPNETPALVNVETCQLVPLTSFSGEIREWVK